MDDGQSNAQNIEDQWIVKYRAALQAVSARKSRGERLRGAFHKAYQSVVTGAGRMVKKFVGAARPKSKTKLKPQLAGSRTGQIPWRKSMPPLGTKESGSKKVG